MVDRAVKRSFCYPAFSSDLDAVVTVGQVIVSFVAMHDLQNVEQEDVDGVLGYDDDDCEKEVVPQISLPDLVVLGNLSLICESYDQQQCYGDQHQSLSLGSICKHRS